MLLAALAPAPPGPPESAKVPMVTSCPVRGGGVSGAGHAAGESLLEEAVELACGAGLVRPHDHIVIVQMVAQAFVLKIITVDGDGEGIKPIRPPSLMDMIKVRIASVLLVSCSKGTLVSRSMRFDLASGDGSRQDFQLPYQSAGLVWLLQCSAALRDASLFSKRLHAVPLLAGIAAYVWCASSFDARCCAGHCGCGRRCRSAD